MASKYKIIIYLTNGKTYNDPFRYTNDGKFKEHVMEFIKWRKIPLDEISIVHREFISGEKKGVITNSTINIHKTKLTGEIYFL